MGPRGYWIALATVLLYLIARPHLGTVWYVDARDAHIITDPFASIVAPGSTPTPIPTAVPTPSVTPRPERFTDRANCQAALTRYESLAIATGAYCASKTALLWGW